MNPGDGTSFSLRTKLESGHHKELTLEIAAWVGRNRRRFAEVVAFMMGTDAKLAARAAWVMSVCVEAHPELLEPHLKDLLDHLERHGLHPAIPRNTFRVLQFAPISGELEARVLSMALAALGGPVAVAVKAYAMTVLKRLAGDVPEIMAEVKLLIDEQMHDASPAFRARARMEFGNGRSRRYRG
jgi:hypothetical protein